MKKLMIAAAAAAMVGGAFAICVPTKDGDPCGAIGFKFTASGKMGYADADLGYKTVSALKFNKGAMLITATYDDGNRSETKTWDELVVKTDTLEVIEGATAGIGGATDATAVGVITNDFAEFATLQIPYGVATNWLGKAAAEAKTNTAAVAASKVPAGCSDFTYQTKVEIVKGVYDSKTETFGPDTFKWTLTQVYSIMEQKSETTTWTEEPSCCYDTVKLYLNGKVGKKAVKLAIEDAALTKWSMFGKKLEDALDLTQVKPGKSFTLDTDIGFGAADGVQDAAGNLEGDIFFMATGFGKLQYKYSKASEGGNVCQPTPVAECIPETIFKNYSGWFAGHYDDGTGFTFDEELTSCLACTPNVFGGTWKATFNKKITDEANAASFAGVRVDAE